VAPAVDGARPLSTLASSASDVVATTTWTVLAYFSEPVADLAAGGLDVVNASVTDLVRTGSASFAVTLTPLAPGAMSVRVPDAAVADAAGNPCRASTTLQRIWFPATAGYAFAVTSATLAGTARGSRVVHVDDAAVPAGDGTWLAQIDLPGPDPKRRTVVVELRMPLASESSIRRTVVLDVGVEPAGGGG
jgi:hypothetical protein